MAVKLRRGTLCCTQVLLAVCLALHYVHTVAKVVHRDLTPANIMLGPGAEGLRCGLLSGPLGLGPVHAPACDEFHTPQ